MKGAGHDRDPKEYDRRDRYRYRQELVSRRRPRWAWRHRAAAEVVAWAGGSTPRQYAGLPDRHGGLCRGPSSEPPAQIAWPRCPADASEVRARLLEGTEERLPRRGGDCRGGSAPDDEVRGDEDRRSIGPAGAAPGARAPGQPAHGHHQPDPRLPLGTWCCRAARAAPPARRVAGYPRYAV